MRYTPLWSDDAAEIRSAASMLTEFPDRLRDAFKAAALEMANDLQGDFPDVDGALLGWVLMRAADHLVAVGAQTPQITDDSLITLALLAGDYLVEGACPRE